MSSREIIYQALAIVRSDRNGQVVVLNKDILSNQAWAIPWEAPVGFP